MLKDEHEVKTTFIFDGDKINKDFYVQNTHLAIRKLNGLFPSFPLNVSIKIFQDRFSFLRAIGKDGAPDWLVAYIPNKSTSSIFFIDHENREKLRGVLLHEMTHLYTNVLSPDLPDWLKEGIAVYVASQIFNSTIKISDWERICPNDDPFENISWDFASEHDGYNIAGLFVVFLVRRYGWVKFIEALKNNPGRFSLENFIRCCGGEYDSVILEFKKEFVK